MRLKPHLLGNDSFTAWLAATFPKKYCNIIEDQTQIKNASALPKLITINIHLADRDCLICVCEDQVFVFFLTYCSRQKSGHLHLENKYVIHAISRKLSIMVYESGGAARHWQFFSYLISRIKSTKQKLQQICSLDSARSKAYSCKILSKIRTPLLATSCYEKIKIKSN